MKRLSAWLADRPPAQRLWWKLGVWVTAAIVVVFLVTWHLIGLGRAWDLLSGHTSVTDAPGTAAGIAFGRVLGVVGYFLLPTLIGTFSGLFVNEALARARGRAVTEERR